jgi:hypothetical protein
MEGRVQGSDKIGLQGSKSSTATISNEMMFPISILHKRYFRFNNFISRKTSTVTLTSARSNASPSVNPEQPNISVKSQGWPLSTSYSLDRSHDEHNRICPQNPMTYSYSMERWLTDDGCCKSNVKFMETDCKATEKPANAKRAPISISCSKDIETSFTGAWSEDKCALPRHGIFFFFQMNQDEY